jgi:hypothetical protein
VRFYRNNGQKLNGEAKELPPIGKDMRYLAPGDLDGDGDLDLWCVPAYYADPAATVLLDNDGAAHFADVSDRIQSASYGIQGDAVLHDCDRDGDLDAIATSSYFDEVDEPLLLFFQNDGTGHFAPSPLAVPVGPGRNLALGDVDGDGDLDVAVAGRDSQDRVFLNLERQLSHRGIPRVGKALSFDVRGGPDLPWLLFVATGTGHVEVSGIEGAFRLAPESAFLFAAGVLDSDGAAVVSMRVPPDPALVGAELHWQALVDTAFGLAFTGRDRTLFTSL